MKRTDFIGLILAAACIVHCLAMPLVLVYLPVWGMGWLTAPWIHHVLLGAGMTLGGLSFLPGHRVHRRAWIPALALCGLGTMAYAAICQEDACCRRPSANTIDSNLPECCRGGHCSAEKWELLQTVSASVATLGLAPWLPGSATPVGATLLLIAHILNLRFRGLRGCTADCCESEATARSSGSESTGFNEGVR